MSVLASGALRSFSDYRHAYFTKCAQYQQLQSKGRKALRFGWPEMSLRTVADPFPHLLSGEDPGRPPAPVFAELLPPASLPGLPRNTRADFPGSGAQARLAGIRPVRADLLEGWPESSRMASLASPHASSESLGVTFHPESCP